MATERIVHKQNRRGRPRRSGKPAQLSPEQTRWAAQTAKAPVDRENSLGQFTGAERANAASSTMRACPRISRQVFHCMRSLARHRSRQQNTRFGAGHRLHQGGGHSASALRNRAGGNRMREASGETRRNSSRMRWTSSMDSGASRAPCTGASAEQIGRRGALDSRRHSERMYRRMGSGKCPRIASASSA